MRSPIKSVSVGGRPFPAFDPELYDYVVALADGSAAVPAITAAALPGAKVKILDAASVAGETVIEVCDEPGAKQSYRFRFLAPQAPSDALSPVRLEDIRVEGGFWGGKLRLMRETTIHDAFDKFEKWKAFDNFDAVAAGGRNVGEMPCKCPFADGLVLETIAAAGDFLRQRTDEKLRQRVDGYIRRICAAAASEKDGYLNTFNQLLTDHLRFDESNAVINHDAYNFGCLCEAAVHYYRGTGSRELLYAACRYANYLCDTFGYGKINMVTPHEGPEAWLLELVALLREQPSLKSDPLLAPLAVDENRYFELVRFWVDNRGNHDDPPRVNHADYGPYAQDDAYYYRQRTAEGHAVRAGLYYYGLAALGRALRSVSHLSAAETIWEDVVLRQMYVTGSVGPKVENEAFDGDYVLPNDGYCETCASAAVGFFSQTMQLALQNGKYADIVEKEMYNSLLGCLGEDGTTYSYVNPLSAKDWKRWAWHGCPCCPPMLLKFYAALPGWAYSIGNDRLYVNQYMDSRATLRLPHGNVGVTQKTGMPWAGDVSFAFDMEKPLRFAFLLRVPAWAENLKVSVNGATAAAAVKDGYAALDRVWSAGDRVEAEFEMTTRRVYADPAVKEDVGKVALMRGPVVYCAEGIDNGAAEGIDNGAAEGIDNGAMKTGEVPSIAKRDQLTEAYEPALLGGVVTVKTRPADETRAPLRAVPFYARGNRGESPYDVWLRETD